MNSTAVIDSVELRVNDIERQVRVYHDVLGLYVRLQPAGRVELAAEYDGPTLIALTGESWSALPAPSHRFGLRCPNLDVLATCTARLIRHGIPVESAMDFGDHVSVPFQDAERNDVELFAFRTELAGDRAPGGDPGGRRIDLNELLSLEMLTSLPVTTDTRVGRVVVDTQDPDRSEMFYREVLGMNVGDRPAGPRVLSTEIDGPRIQLRRSESNAPSNRDSEPTGLSRVRLSVPADECRLVYERAVQHGIGAAGSPTEFTLVDPNRLFVDVNAR